MVVVGGILVVGGRVQLRAVVEAVSVGVPAVGVRGARGARVGGLRQQLSLQYNQKSLV